MQKKKKIGGADRRMEFACKDEDFFNFQRIIEFRFLWDIISENISITLLMLPSMSDNLEV